MGQKEPGGGASLSANPIHHESIAELPSSRANNFVTLLAAADKIRESIPSMSSVMSSSAEEEKGRLAAERVVPYQVLPKGYVGAPGLLAAREIVSGSNGSIDEEEEEESSSSRRTRGTSKEKGALKRHLANICQHP